MTVKERARACTAEMGAGDIWERAIEAIEKHLRDQVEDCAKIAIEPIRKDGFLRDKYPSEIAREIRALAAPKEEIPDGPDDRFDLGGFECNEKPID